MPSKKKTVTRTEIQKALAKPLAEALEKLGITKADPTSARRVLRALVTLGAKPYIDHGVEPEHILMHCFEAISREVARQEHESKRGEGLFGELPPAKA